MIRPTVLCVEDTCSHFTASQQIFASGNYHVITATNVRSALTAFRAVSTLNAAVLACTRVGIEQQVEIASAMGLIRPEIPKVILCEPGDSALAGRLVLPGSGNIEVVSVDRITTLLEELRRMIAWGRVRAERSAMLLEASQQLSAESARVRARSRELQKQLKRTLRFKNNQS